MNTENNGSSIGCLTNPVEHNGKLYVEVPKGAVNIRTTYHLPHGTDLVYEIIDLNCIALPPGTWQLIADTETMTEEIAAGLVERVSIRTEVPVRVSGFILTERFKNYTEKDQYLYSCSTAIESFQTLLISLGLGMVNPLGKQSEMHGHGSEFYNGDIDAWQADQSRLIQRLVILKRIK